MIVGGIVVGGIVVGGIVVGGGAVVDVDPHTFPHKSRFALGQSTGLIIHQLSIIAL